MAQAQNPAIAAASPAYPGPYSPYATPGQEMGQHGGHYTPAYPPWPGYGAHPQIQYNSPPSTASTPTTGPPRPGQQVYSFVPIPGAQQSKRPRRRYEEIDRIYKCGHQNCEKAYGTLNHLNAHVTMQGHGPKRTPEEFKDIRREWRSRQKKDVDPKKPESDPSRTDSGPDAQLADAPSPPEATQTPTTSTFSSRPQLPPLGYTNNPNGNAATFSPSDPLYQGGPAQVYSTYPHSPYNNSSQVFQRQ